MPPLKDVTTMITAARSRAMRFTMIIQNYAQLNEVYGEQNAETIKGNCGNTVYLISTELKALKEISEMCGEIKVKTGKDDKEKEETRPLITVSDLQKMKMNEVIIRRIRMAPFKTKLTPEWQMQWEHKYREASVNNIKARERRVVSMFDVREFVKSKKKSAPSPFGGMPAGFGMPFGGMDDNVGFPGLFDSPSPSPRNNGNGKIDVDKILANLDAKIAEIEAEEKKMAEMDDLESKKVSEDSANINENREEKTVPIVNNPPEKNIFETKINSQFNPLNNNISNVNSNNSISFENSNINQSNELEKSTSIHELLPTIDDDFEPFIKTQEFTKEEDNKDIDLLVDKIKDVSNPNVQINNIKPNMEVSKENKYTEVSDDEFFDDFFDD
ncbi:MAG: TraM recognition domain-containing protein [Bacilli bacterium]|nr:TraM recognition domain-containing protein [Bacilli bacterium]